MTSRTFAHAVFLARSAVESTGGNLLCINSYFFHINMFNACPKLLGQTVYDYSIGI